MNEASSGSTRRFARRDLLMLAGGVLLALAAFGVWTVVTGGEEPAPTAEAEATADPPADRVTVTSDVLKVAAIETAAVAVGPRLERIEASGVVEPNELRMQEVTPLVAGRVERVPVVEGTVVTAGTVLLTMSSPEVAELQGNLRAAEARRAEATATLTRTKRLVDLGAGAGKDLIAAEAEERAVLAEVTQLRQRLEALGASAPSDSQAVASTVTIRAPASATVLERLVNVGQSIEAGTPLMRLADLSNVWVIVNVPEARLSSVHVGAPVEIRGAGLDNTVVSGRVSYIDAQLDAETRTAPVRVEVPNPGGRLKIGMFVEAAIEGVQTGSDELTVPSTAIQRVGERTVVFVPSAEPGVFDVRDVEVGRESGQTRVVLTGLRAGERVVSKGGFTLKSQLLKGEFGEDEELPGREEP